MNRRGFLGGFALGAAGLYVPKKSYFFLGGGDVPVMRFYDPFTDLYDIQSANRFMISQWREIMRDVLNSSTVLNSPRHRLLGVGQLEGIRALQDANCAPMT